MNIALLGFGKEGQAAETYFKQHFSDANITKFTDFDPVEITKQDFSAYDLILRSPSVPPHAGWTSMTRYFFDRCPCPIIGVTATKGKGTTCSFIKSILDSLGAHTYLVGNIGNPAITVLDELKPTDVVVYEMSSFQLWDLEKSPHIAVVGTIEPDHLNVHRDFDDYIMAKANIGAHQSASDYLIYYANNPDTLKIATKSPAIKLTYPTADIPADILNAIKIPGQHNLDNASAAILAVASYYNQSVAEFIQQNADKVKQGLANFHGLPHRLEFVREINGIPYYDDNFATNAASTRVAIDAFPNHQIVLILGGRDKTNYADLPEIYEMLKSHDNITKIILIGESGHKIAQDFTDNRFIVAESLAEAVSIAKQSAESIQNKAVVLMSPAAASFDMFENVYDRGDQYQKLISEI